MYNIGAYPQMPSRTEIRQMYASTDAEKAGAAKVEGDKSAAAVVDDVNSVMFSMKRLDQSERDGNEEKGQVSISAQPKDRNWFQRATGMGETPVEEIADRNSEKGDKVSNVTGSMTEKEMEVVVNYEGDKAPLIYTKSESDDGTVFFQRGNEIVGMNPDGLLFMDQVPSAKN